MLSDNHNSPLVQTPENYKTHYVVTCRQHTNFTRLSQNHLAWEDALHRNKNQGLQIICATIFSEWLDMTPYPAFHRVAQHHFYERNSDGTGRNLHSSTATQTQACQFILFCNKNSLGQYIHFSIIIYSLRIFAKGFVQNLAAKNVGVSRARDKGYQTNARPANNNILII